MTRKDARELMMQVFFQMDVNQDIDEKPLDLYVGDKDIKLQEKYCRQIFDAYLRHKKDADELIDKHSRGWSPSRMAKTDIAILRLSTLELVYMQEEVPQKASINEAVELAKKYGTDNAPKFINAILGSIAKDISGTEDEK